MDALFGLEGHATAEDEYEVAITYHTPSGIAFLSVDVMDIKGEWRVCGTGTPITLGGVKDGIAECELQIVGGEAPILAAYCGHCEELVPRQELTFDGLCDECAEFVCDECGKWMHDDDWDTEKQMCESCAKEHRVCSKCEGVYRVETLDDIGVCGDCLNQGDQG